MESYKIHGTTYYQEMLRVIRLNGIIMPFVVVAAGLLVKFNLISQASYAGDWWFFVISATFMVVAGLYALQSDLSKARYLLFSIIYHTLAMAFLLFISGMFSPFLVLWVVLFIGSDSFFGGRTLWYNGGFLVLGATAHVLLHPEFSSQQIAGLGLAVVLTIVVCRFIAQIRSIGDRERLDLANTRNRETFERNRVLALVNSMNDAVISTDETGTIKVYNAAFLNLIDSHAELVGKSLSRYIKLETEGGQKLDLLAEAQQRQGNFTREDLVLKFADGETLSLFVSVSPIRLSYHTDGEHGYIFIFRDITKQKTLEEERDEFISVVSHELRTPVAIAEGNVSNVRLLRDKNMPPAAVDRALDETHEQIMYLAKMVNDLSALSRAERGLDADLEQINLNELLTAAYQKYAPDAAKKGLRLDLDIAAGLPNITTSRLYLEEILQNFLTNAIKYTKAGGVTLGASAKKEGISISVTDTGIGIGKADQKHMFEKFYRSEDYRTRESSGTGLGLYVTKKLAAKMGAQIGFESRLNHGSTFTITLTQ